MKPGATGTFTIGRINDNDDVSLVVCVARRQDNVLIDFGVPVRSLSVTTDQAIAFAWAIMKKAGVTRLDVEIS